MPCYLLISATQITRVIMVYLTCLLVTVHCCCSVTKSFLTLYNPLDCSMPVLRYVPEFAETHVLCFTALDFTFTTGYIHNWLSFPLWPSCFILSGSINNCPLLFPSSLLGTSWPGGGVSSSSLVISFYLFILFMEFSWQECWSGLPFPPPIDHVLSELFIMTCLSWVVLYGMAYSFIELCKPFLHNKPLIHEGEQCLIVFFL